jgi:hypothetical protein
MSKDEHSVAIKGAVPQVILEYLELAGRTNRADADRIAACFTEDGQVTDFDQISRSRTAIRRWWQGQANTHRYVAEVRGGHGLGNDRYVVFIPLVGDFPGCVLDLANRFTVQDGRIAELEIAAMDPG